MIFFSFLVLAWIGLLTILLWDLIQKGQNKLYMFILIPASLVLTITTYFTVGIGIFVTPGSDIKPISTKAKIFIICNLLWVIFFITRYLTHQ